MASKKAKILILTPILLLVMALIGYGLTVLFISIFNPLPPAERSAHFLLEEGIYLCAEKPGASMEIRSITESEYSSSSGLDSILDDEGGAYFTVSIDIDGPLHAKGLKSVTKDQYNRRIVTNRYRGEVVDGSGGSHLGSIALERTGKGTLAVKIFVDATEKESHWSFSISN